MCFLDGVLEDVHKWTNSGTPSFVKMFYRIQQDGSDR